MSYLTASPITLDGVPLQIKDGGFSVGAISAVDDEAQPWQARASQGALRDDSDKLSFDMVSVTGARTRVSYSTDSPAPGVPANNTAALADIYKKTMRRSISISGTTMDAANYATFYGHYVDAQDYWALRAVALAKINDGDIPWSVREAEIVALGNITKPTLAFVSPFLSGPVTFANGGSCSFSAYIENIVSDFSFELIYDTQLPSGA